MQATIKGVCAGLIELIFQCHSPVYLQNPSVVGRECSVDINHSGELVLQANSSDWMQSCFNQLHLNLVFYQRPLAADCV